MVRLSMGHGQTLQRSGGRGAPTVPPVFTLYQEAVLAELKSLGSKMKDLMSRLKEG